MRAGWIEQLIKIVGPEYVLTAEAQCAVYECDGYTLERARPEGVVIPGTVEETVEVVRVLHQLGRPIMPRGAGTGLAGGCLAAPGGVVVALNRLREVEILDAENGQALVQAGVVNASLSALSAPHGLHYAPDPSSQQACTLGGNIATNSGGPHTLKYGVTVNHVLAVELVRPDGTRNWIGARHPGQGGPDLTGLVVGHEGTFGLVTRAWVRLIPTPPSVRTLLASFSSVDQAASAVSRLLASGVLPAAVEMMDAPILLALSQAYGLAFPKGAEAVLLVEVDGLDAGLDEDAGQIESACREAGAFEVSRAADPRERLRLWSARKRAFGALGRLARNYCTQDGVVPRSKLPETLDAIGAIGRRYRISVANVFHAGDGNLHPILLYDERDADQVRRVFQASAEILRVCLSKGGSLTGEHGIGVEKRGLMTEAFSEGSLEAMERIRGAFDPDRRANPGKLLPSGPACTDPVQWRHPERQVPL